MSSRHLSWSAKVPIGDANGVKVYASTDFIRYYEQGRERMGGDTALTNIELATVASAAQTTANAAVTAAGAAQTTANTANSTANALKLPQYVTLTSSGDLTNERVLTAGATSNLVLVDGGAGLAVSLALAPDITGTALGMTIQPKAPGAAEHGGTITVKGRNAVGAAYNGGGLVLQSGDGGSAGYGGDFTLASGGGDSGGQLSVSGGAGVTAGGGIAFTAGDASGVGGLGASITFQGGGAANAAGLGGSINFVPGLGGLTSGSVVLRGANGFYGLEVTDDRSGALVAMFGATPVYQPTTAITGATFTANAGTAVNDASTFDGYTVKQVVKALRDLGILA